MTSSFTLLAAVELSAGQTAIRSKQRIAVDAEFGDPVDDAAEWLDQGATWLHVADLDGGQIDNRAAAARLHRAARGRAHTQFAGGIANQDDLDWALAVGFDRIVVDPGALGELAWLRQVFATHGHRVVAGIDVRGSALWAPGSDLHGTAVTALVAPLAAAGCPGYVVTSIDREATRKGPDRALIDEICALAVAPVCVAGGIATLEHLYELSTMVEQGVVSAIVDAALYRDYFSVAEALAAIAPRFDPFQWGPAQPWGLTQGL